MRITECGKRNADASGRFDCDAFAKRWHTTIGRFETRKAVRRQLYSVASHGSTGRPLFPRVSNKVATGSTGVQTIKLGRCP